MTRPNIIIRFFGFPAIALVVFALCALVIFNWWYGPLYFWEALMALGVAYRTTRAVNRMRHYKDFAKNWNALHEEVAGYVPATPAGKSRGRVWVALLLFLLLPAVSVGMKTQKGLSNGLLIVWGFVALYMGWVFLAWFGRTVKRSAGAAKGRRVQKANEAPVSWMLGRASDSPGRAEIQRALPADIQRIMVGAAPKAKQTVTPKRRTGVFVH